MKAIKSSKSEINDFIDSLYANGRTASERFGVTWQMLSQLELEALKIVIRTSGEKRELRTG
jgi:hypothetical protein